MKVAPSVLFDAPGARAAQRTNRPTQPNQSAYMYFGLVGCPDPHRPTENKKPDLHAAKLYRPGIFKLLKIEQR